MSGASNTCSDAAQGLGPGSPQPCPEPCAYVCAQVVGVLKKEVMKTQSKDLEKGAEYRQLLVQAIHSWCGAAQSRKSALSQPVQFTPVRWLEQGCGLTSNCAWHWIPCAAVQISWPVGCRQAKTQSRLPTACQSQSRQSVSRRSNTSSHTTAPRYFAVVIPKKAVRFAAP